MRQLIPKYQYLDSIAKRIAAPNSIDKNWLIDEYHLSGSRHSGKTTCVGIELAKCIALVQASNYYNNKLAIYSFRRLSTQANELDKEVQIALDDIGIEYNYTKFNRTYKFKNGSQWKVMSVYSPSGSVNLKGESGVDADYIITWVEEANELKQRDFENIYFSVRSKNPWCKNIKITTCNPDLIYQDHIKFLNEHAPFSHYEMKTYNEQFTIKNILNKRRLFHYGNFKINPYVAEDIKRELEELRVWRPVQAIPWYYGLPGSLSGSVFGNYLPTKKSVRDWVANTYRGGLDFGAGESPQGHPTSCVFVSVNFNNTKFHVEREYSHSNAKGEFKSTHDIARDVANFYIQCCDIFKVRKPFDLICDYGGGGIPFADTLKSFLRDFGYEHLIKVKFVDKSKFMLNDRVDITQILLAKKDLSWDDNVCPELTRTMNLIKYKDVKNEETYKLALVDLNDDLWDSLCYSIMDLVANNMRYTNQFLISKELRRRL